MQRTLPSPLLPYTEDHHTLCQDELAVLYPMAVPPKEALRFLNPERFNVRNGPKKSKDEVDRSLFHGWDNYTTFEKESIQKLKEYIAGDQNMAVLSEQVSSAKIDDGEILKYLQTYQFSMKVTAKALQEHASW